MDGKLHEPSKFSFAVLQKSTLHLLLNSLKIWALLAILNQVSVEFGCIQGGANLL